MAGVGFELKKLFRARTAVGHVKAYAYASVVTTGPFLLMTGMVLAVQLLFSAHGVAAEDAMLFVASVAYVFVFSQLLSSGFVMVLTRYLADCLSAGHYRDVTASLFGMGALLTLLGSAVAAVFFAASPLGFAEAGLTYVFFLELLLIWTQSVYLTAIKKFQRLITGFAASVSLSVALCAGLLAAGPRRYALRCSRWMSAWACSSASFSCISCSVSACRGTGSISRSCRISSATGGFSSQRFSTRWGSSCRISSSGWGRGA